MEVDESVWFRMSQEERESHLKKVHAAIPGKQNKTLSEVAMNVNEVTELTNLPPCLQAIWQKTSRILSSPDNITSAPGHPPTARMVISCSGQRPHLVSP